MSGAHRQLARRLVRDADAWRLLCEELRISPEVLLADLPGYATVGRAEAEARLLLKGLSASWAVFILAEYEEADTQSYNPEKHSDAAGEATSVSGFLHLKVRRIQGASSDPDE